MSHNNKLVVTLSDVGRTVDNGVFRVEKLHFHASIPRVPAHRQISTSKNVIHCLIRHNELGFNQIPRVNQSSAVLLFFLDLRYRRPVTRRHSQTSPHEVYCAFQRRPFIAAKVFSYVPLHRPFLRLGKEANPNANHYCSNRSDQQAFTHGCSVRERDAKTNLSLTLTLFPKGEGTVVGGATTLPNKRPNC